MRTLKALIIIALFLVSACKKDKQTGTDITAQSITGTWVVSNLVYQTYQNGKLYQENSLETSGYEFEFKSDGTVGYHEGNITSSGQYTIKYESGKYLYWVGIQGRNGAPDEGTAEIKMLNKNSFILRFEISDVVGLRSVVLETMVRK